MAVTKGEPGRIDISRCLLEGAEAGLHKIYASTLAEVCGHGAVRAAAEVATIDPLAADFFSSPFIKWVDVASRLLGTHAVCRVNTGCAARMRYIWPRQMP